MANAAFRRNFSGKKRTNGYASLGGRCRLFINDTFNANKRRSVVHGHGGALYGSSYKPGRVAVPQRRFVRFFVQTRARGGTSTALCTILRTNPGAWRSLDSALYGSSYKPGRVAVPRRRFVRFFVQTRARGGTPMALCTVLRTNPDIGLSQDRNIDGDGPACPPSPVQATGTSRPQAPPRCRG